jgi:hypothetical protein
MCGETPDNPAGIFFSDQTNYTSLGSFLFNPQEASP